MRLVNRDNIDLKVLEGHVRMGHLATWNLLEGEEGTEQNYSLRLAEIEDYSSPRHRHGFDQVRLQVDGVMDFARDGKMRPGTVGYFPESVHYGPHETEGPKNLQLVLQFTGVSGTKYISEKTYKKAVVELSENGSFDKGAYTQIIDGKKHNKDGYLAVWEHVFGHPLDYAAPRFQAPVFMQSDAFEWQPVEEDGVRVRRMARFTHKHIGADFIAIDAGATYTVEGPALLFVTKGKGEAEGERWGQYSAAELKAGESAAFAASEDGEILKICMPWD